MFFYCTFCSKKKEKENKGKNILITGMSLSKTPSRKHDRYKIKYTAMSQYISEPFKKNIHRAFSCVIFSVHCTLSPHLLQNHSNNARFQNGSQQLIKQINKQKTGQLQ